MNNDEESSRSPNYTSKGPPATEMPSALSFALRNRTAPSIEKEHKPLISLQIN